MEMFQEQNSDETTIFAWNEEPPFVRFAIHEIEGQQCSIL
jgi:hypothetical protein